MSFQKAIDEIDVPRILTYGLIQIFSTILALWLLNFETDAYYLIGAMSLTLSIFFAFTIGRRCSREFLEKTAQQFGKHSKYFTVAKSVQKKLLRNPWYVLDLDQNLAVFMGLFLGYVVSLNRGALINVLVLGTTTSSWLACAVYYNWKVRKIIQEAYREVAEKELPDLREEKK